MATNELIFRLLALALFGATMGISIFYRHRAEVQGGRQDRATSRRTLVILRLSSLIAFAPLVAYLLNPAWVEWARLPLPTWARWVGFLLAAAVIPGFAWVFRTIGNNISPVETTREGHQLVTGGPYRFVRHPLYSLGTVFLVGLTLLTALWTLPVGLALPYVVLLRRTDREEANLVAAFGDDYRDYMGRTGRFVPRFDT